MVSSAVTASLQIIPNFYLVRIRNTIITTAEDSLIFDLSRKWNNFLNSTLANLTTMKIFGILIYYKTSTYVFTNGFFTTEEVRKTSFYNSNIAVSYELGNSDFQNIFSLNYILNDRQVNVNHSADRKLSVSKNFS